MSVLGQVSRRQNIASGDRSSRDRGRHKLKNNRKIIFCRRGISSLADKGGLIYDER